MNFFLKLSVLCVCLTQLITPSQARLPTAAEIDEIMEAHNRARSETANEEQVGNMPELVWSPAVANIGANYFNTNGCVFSHNPNRQGTGENLARGQRSWTAAIYDGWYASERDAYLRGSRSLNAIGHYTQVTWDRTLEVGCAICNENTYICNYSPPGNFNGLEAYQTGNAPCTTCASSHPQCTTGQLAGLCTNGTGGPPPPPTTTQPGQTNPPQTNPPTNPPGNGGDTACGPVQQGIWHQDFASFLDFAQSPSIGDCCSRCQNRNGCQAYTFGTLSQNGATQCAMYGSPLNGAAGQASNAASANLVAAEPSPPSPVDPCEGDPCRNGGTCQPNGNTFSCDCSTASGWEGPTCEDDIDNCNPNPCFNGGVCTDLGVNDFECDCQNGFDGVQCQVVITTTQQTQATTTTSRATTTRATTTQATTTEATTSRTTQATTSRTQGTTTSTARTTSEAPETTAPGQTAPPNVCDAVVNNPCRSGQCVENTGSPFGWSCECPENYESPITENACNHGPDGRLLFTIEEGVNAADSDEFLQDFNAAIAQFLNVDAARIKRSAIISFGPPTVVEAVVGGEANENSPTVPDLYLRMVQSESTQPRQALTDRDALSAVTNVECVGCGTSSNNPDASTSEGGESGGSNMGMIIGVVIGVVVVLVLAVVFGIVGYKRYKNNKTTFYEDQNSMANVNATATPQQTGGYF